MQYHRDMSPVSMFVHNTYFNMVYQWVSQLELSKTPKSVLHGIVWYCMELLCILWYRIVFMSFHCIIWYCMVLYYILRYCMVLHCWVRRAGCISQDTYLLYFIQYIYEDKAYFSFWKVNIGGKHVWYSLFLNNRLRIWWYAKNNHVLCFCSGSSHWESS